ncbi:hypothetical protein NSQ59_21810 [Margalitia sp. FSL K6-0131]
MKRHKIGRRVLPLRRKVQFNSFPESEESIKNSLLWMMKIAFFKLLLHPLFGAVLLDKNNFSLAAEIVFF